MYSDTLESHLVTMWWTLGMVCPCNLWMFALYNDYWYSICQATFQDGRFVSGTVWQGCDIKFLMLMERYIGRPTNLEGRSEVEVQTYTSVRDNEFYLKAL